MLFALVLFMAAFSNAIAQGHKDDFVEKLKWLESANPELDAKNAIDRKDFRLRAIYGYVLIVPGLDQRDYDEYKKTFGFNPIEGTSDSLISSDHARFNQLASEYAFRYNKVILNHKKK
jgi:hypothetical protein